MDSLSKELEASAERRRLPERQTARFLAAGVVVVIEPDFSLWRDDPLAVQVYNVFRSRWLGRLWQEAGLSVIPSLNWSDERSFEFCFTGIPQYAPVVACEARTAGQTDEDRRAFLAGLAEGVRQVQPQHMMIYGGQEHSFWLTPHLPPGPRYTLLESWTHARDRIRRHEERRRRHHNQLKLSFPSKGADLWVDEAVAAAVPAVAAA